MHNPLSAVHQLIWQSDSVQREGEFIGTCFAFRHRSYLLTAQHCVKHIPTKELRVVSAGAGPSDSLVRQIAAVHSHPTADIAILETSDSPLDPSQPFWDCVGNYGLGEDFIAYGYPESIFAEQSYERIINYGIALMLDPIKDWLNQNIPKRDVSRP